MKKHGRLLISILLLFLLIILPQDGHITAATIHEVSGSRIPLDMDVQNLGAACQVRFKVCVYTGGELLRELTEAELELADGWERKKDGYLYHTGILEEDGILELYDAVIASSDIITKEDQTLVLETTIQAVQSEHLEVSSDGWGDTEIRQTLRSRNEVRSDA